MSGVRTIDMALRSAAPDRLVEALDAHLSQVYGTKSSIVWLADYRAFFLEPIGVAVRDLADSEVQAAAAARSYASQSPVTESSGDDLFVRVHLPLTAWGERVGVLTVGIERARAVSERAGLQEMAAAFTGAFQAVDRRTDRYHTARRRSRLTMAAEMQWDLLPARGFAGHGTTLAGQLEPAYAVCGDHFDWAVNDDWLTVTSLNGMGSGLDAAMLTALAVNAMRNARRSQADPAALVDQAVLAADAVYSQYGGTLHLATLLLSLNMVTGELRLIDAGSPRLILVRGGQLRDMVLDPQLPIGMFGDTRYAEETEQLKPGDRLFVVSDGVHGAVRPGEPAYGERELSRAIRSTRLQPPAEAIGSVMRSLHDYHAGMELADDALVVCIDWSPQA